MKNNLLYKVFALVAVSIFGLTGTGQAQENTLYSMKHVPQYMISNPAHQPEAKLVIGFPLLSSIHTEIYNSGLSISDIYKEKSVSSDKPYMLDLDNMRNTLEDKNNLSLDFQLNILDVGVALRDNYFLNLGMNTKISENFGYSNLLEVTKGNFRPDGSPLVFSFDQDFSVYNEIYAGLSKKFYNGLTLGLKAKYLAGLVNVDTKAMDISWHTNTNGFYEYTFNTDIEIRTSSGVPYEFTTDSDGSYNGIALKDTTQFDENPSADFIKSQLFANSGFGVDLGAVYEINKNFKVSASIIDLGFIKWKNNPQVLTQKADLYHPGFDPGKYVNDFESAVSLDVNALTDSVIQDYMELLNQDDNLQLKDEEYKTRLNTKFFLGGNYTPVEWFDIGLLYRGTRIDKKTYSAFTASANLNFLRGWAFSTSYTRMYKTNNLGVGVAYKIGPFQYYLVSDNVSIPLYAVSNSQFATDLLYNTKQAGVHFGFNFILSKKQPDYGLIDDKLAY